MTYEKTEPKKYKDTTEQEKTPKTHNLVLKTEKPKAKSEAKSENKGDLVLKTEKPKAKKEPLKYELPVFIDMEDSSIVGTGKKNLTNINGLSGSFMFSGTEGPFTGTDWVGLQVEGNNDKGQLSWQNGTLVVR